MFRLFVFLLFTAGAWAQSPAHWLEWHQDHRQTPQIELNPDEKVPSDDIEGALAFLNSQADRYGLAHSGTLLHTATQYSLLGSHYTFQQWVEGIPVLFGEIIVSVEYGSRRVMMVGNNLYPVPAGLHSKAPGLTREDAFDIAWDHLGVTGFLLEEPTERLLWLPQGKELRLIRETYLPVEAPFGYWLHHIDAHSGEILDFQDAALTRKERQVEIGTPGVRLARTSEFARFQRSQRAVENKAALRASGQASLFDPDPRTSLMNETIQDGSPGSAFTAAYFPRTLLDITLSAGTYSLVGPWCQIINFEAPNTAPSTTGDGNWSGFSRGNNAFNDAMTYFHIDQSQRYMQSLGFTGGTGIQQLSIEADSDGLNGDDNSHYIPSSNRLAFGHGCVDDNEDQFVILHEYGHAIQRGIAGSNWSGGDTGAMGEGFGDYWGGSYKFRSPNGPTFHPEWAFPWDGHGTGNQCWPGRMMNLTSAAQYDHAHNYAAHSSHNGVNGDELWSTPIFQSLVTLVGLGEGHGEVDQIILQSHFGIPSGLKMRGMANIMINTASTLFPGGPHAQVFTDKFLVHNIVDVPTVSLNISQVTVTDPGSNGVADPGETIQLQVQLTNQGTLGSTGVSAVLSTNLPGVTITQASSNYPDLAIGGNGNNTSLYVVELSSSLNCGDAIPFTLDVTYSGALRATTQLSFQLATGVATTDVETVTPSLPITDNNTTLSTLTIAGSGRPVDGGLSVDIDITHTYIGDLLITLQSPDGTSVVLHNRTGGSTHNLAGNYPGTLTPANSLSAFIGDAQDGTWTLSVADQGSGDTGTLNSWGIHYTESVVCESASPCGTANFATLISYWRDAGTYHPSNDPNANSAVDVADLVHFMGLACP